MSSYIEIGDFIEAIPNPIKVVDIPAIVPTPTVVNTIPIATSPLKPNGSAWKLLLLIAIAVGSALIYYNMKKDETT